MSRVIAAVSALAIVLGVTAVVWVVIASSVVALALFDVSIGLLVLALAADLFLPIRSSRSAGRHRRAY